ncbi:histidine kinase [Caballeronia sp. LjRoot31]|uniref:histidine kinase n=1 Tax=Caballeronia sp. LjRoot31 TaxID=3342324 RepID=UPI003ECCE127
MPGLTAISTFCAPTSISFVSTAQAAPSKLGDLPGFRRIVADTAIMVNKGDLAGARTRIKDLETSWDDAEPSLKPRGAADRHKVDKSIDQALSALREKAPNAASCKQALSDLLAVIDQASGR